MSDITPNTAGASATAPQGVLANATQRSTVTRALRERTIFAGLIGSGLFSIGITAAIVFVLVSEALSFFRDDSVSIVQFLTGLKWNPLLGGEKHFGIWPLVSGTMMVALVAALVALPVGLITAVYLSEFAPSKVRAVIKPVLEVLAGIPTVVYGFFALTVITPALQWLSVLVQKPFVADPEPWFEFFNSTSAGIAVGIMCLPMVCSLSEDALRAVPRSLRDGAQALGSTNFDTSVRVVVPAALSGIVASFLLAIARAVGETMIVALAAGSLSQMAMGPTGEGFIFRPHEGSQTMTGYMVQIFKGDVAFNSVEYYSAYAVGLTLFVLTLVLTIAGNIVLKKFREVYE